MLACLIVPFCVQASGRYVDHALSFNVLASDPKTVVLDYRYSVRGKTILAPDRRGQPEGAMFHLFVAQPMEVGDELYVKWRDERDGRIYEQTAPLSFPVAVAGQAVYVSVKKDKLEVYLISRQRREPSDPPGPSGYQQFKSYQIYPPVLSR